MVKFLKASFHSPHVLCPTKSKSLKQGSLSNLGYRQAKVGQEHISKTAFLSPLSGHSASSQVSIILCFIINMSHQSLWHLAYSCNILQKNTNMCMCSCVHMHFQFADTEICNTNLFFCILDIVSKLLSYTSQEKP